MKLKLRLFSLLTLSSLLVACMSNPVPINITQEADRFALNTNRLGDEITKVKQHIEQDFSRAPQCQQQANQTRCDIEAAGSMSLAGHPVKHLQYALVDDQLQQFDLRITATSEASYQTIADAITQSLQIKPQKDAGGLMWQSKKDFVMLQQQGDILMRIVDRQHSGIAGPRPQKILKK